jgi:PAS domain S-box-containing protein
MTMSSSRPGPNGSEARTDKITRLYATLAETNRALSRAHNPECVFHEVCSIAVNTGKFRMVWIGLVGEDGWIRPAGRAGRGSDYVDEIRISALEIPEGLGPTGTAVREGRHTSCDNIERAPTMAPWRDRMAEYGYRSSGSFPIRVNGEIVGALSAYADTPHFFGRDETELFAQLAEDVSYALTALETKRAFRRTDDLLRKSEQRFHAVFENSIDAMLLIDDDRTFLEANAAACRLFGRPREQIVGTRQEDITGIPVEKARRAWQSFMEDGRHDNHWPLRLSDGTQRLVDCRATAHVQPGTHLAILRDVTEQHLLEAQFRQAQKMEAVGQLAGGVAHDFNNLLSVISGYAELALSETSAADSSRREPILQVQGAAQRAAELTRQLLAFSRRQTLDIREISLNDSIAEVVPLLARLLGDDITVTTTLDRGLRNCLADPRSFEQVLMNLAVNAAHAMPDGGTIEIRTCTRSLTAAGIEELGLGLVPGCHVTLAVTDSGVGMDDATRDRIFEPFFTTKSEDIGTGLGLSTVHGIVHQSGGDIRVETALGRGTTFTIYLPALPDAAVHANAQITSARLPCSSGCGTILLAEDKPSLRRLLETIMTRRGYTVVVAANAHDAERIASDTRVDVLVTDVVMPGGSGIDLADRLRKTQPDLPVVFMSGFSAEIIEDRGAIDDRKTQYLAKPFANDDLLHALERCLAATPPN